MFHEYLWVPSSVYQKGRPWVDGPTKWIYSTGLKMYSIGSPAPCLSDSSPSLFYKSTRARLSSDYYKESSQVQMRYSTPCFCQSWRIINATSRRLSVLLSKASGRQVCMTSSLQDPRCSARPTISRRPGQRPEARVVARGGSRLHRAPPSCYAVTPAL